jgi:hypothetical protein
LALTKGPCRESKPDGNCDSLDFLAPTPAFFGIVVRPGPRQFGELRQTKTQLVIGEGNLSAVFSPLRDVMRRV